MKKSRAFFLVVILIFVTAAVIVRLFALQVMSHGIYKDLAENQHQAYRTLVPVRGEIFIRDQSTGGLVPIVTNIEKDLVYAVPPEITDKKTTARELAELLEMPYEDILQRISQDNRQWVSIKKQLPESVSLAVNDLDLPGIYTLPETYRLYTEQDFASQVLGFVGYEGSQLTGQYGIERKFEEILSGKSGSLALERDAFGRWISRGLRELQPAQDGADIVLTINRAIQHKAEEILEKTVETHQADSGSLVVMNPKNGAILAMANYPGFNPNNYSEVEDQAVYRNRAVSDAYEPGSVFKPVTIAAALDAEAITPEMTYEDTGSVAIDGYTIKNSDLKAHGVQNMIQVLEESLNTGVIFVQNRLGGEKFLSAVKKFGFGKAVGIDLPSEAVGNIQNLIGGGDVHYATASFGQGITTTLLQLVQAYGVIANDGKLIKPYIVESIQYADGKIEQQKDNPSQQVISSRAANTTAAMLVSVVENGHGKRAAVSGYYVAGKTGTAQVVRPGGSGYDPNHTIGTFAGFAPVNNPEFVMAVQIDNPKTVRFAESTAAPAFGEMARFLLNYFQVPTSR